MSEGSSKAAVKNLGWRVTLAGLGINLALGILYIWSVISRGVPDEWGWSQLDTWPGFDLFARIRPRLTAGAFQPVRARRLFSPNRKIFEARKRETAALGAGEKLVLGHPLAATIGDSARCMQNLEKVLFTGPKTSDTVTFICD